MTDYLAGYVASMRTDQVAQHAVQVPDRLRVDVSTRAKAMCGRLVAATDKPFRPDAGVVDPPCQACLKAVAKAAELEQEDQSDAILLAGRSYDVLGRLALFSGNTVVCQVILAQRGDSWMTCKVRNRDIVDAPLVARSLNEVLAGFAVRVGADLRTIYQG